MWLFAYVADEAGDLEERGVAGDRLTDDRSLEQRSHYVNTARSCFGLILETVSSNDKVMKCSHQFTPCGQRLRMLL